MARPKKSLGQHFLRDDHYLEQIVAALEPVPGELVLEIGSGRGALTGHLLAAGLRVHALEIDPDLVRHLRDTFGGDPAFAVTLGDACTADYTSFGKHYKVAGNLPYQAATAITTRLLDFTAGIPLMVLMYQMEVARRLTAEPGSRSYGSLTCLARFHCATEYLFTIPPGAFWPPPKIRSGAVRFRPHPEPPLAPVQREELFALIRDVFSHRRKTLLNALASSGRAPEGKDALRDQLAGWGIDAGRRPETFSLDEFMLLRKILGWEGARPRPAGSRPGETPVD